MYDTESILLETDWGDQGRRPPLPWVGDPLCGSVVPPWGPSLRRISSPWIWLCRWHCSGRSHWPDTPPDNQAGHTGNTALVPPMTAAKTLPSHIYMQILSVYSVNWEKFPRLAGFWLNLGVMVQNLTFVRGTTPRPSLVSTSEAAASER